MSCTVVQKLGLLQHKSNPDEPMDPDALEFNSNYDAHIEGEQQDSITNTDTSDAHIEGEQ